MIPLDNEIDVPSLFPYADNGYLSLLLVCLLLT